jgi:general secretion pathway protein N
VTRRAAALAALGIAAYVAFLVAMLPARFVVARVALPPGLTLEGVEGSIWSGHARATWQSAAPLDIAWHWRPAGLFAAHVAYEVEARGSTLDAHARVARGFSQWSVEDLQLEGDAAALSAFVPLATPWQPAGRLQASAVRLAWNARGLSGAADARWLDASLALAPVRPLGTYLLHIEGEGGPARVRVTTSQGTLRITGEGSLETSGHFAFNGEARGEGADAQQLASLLDLIGPRRPDGSRAIRLAS